MNPSGFYPFPSNLSPILTGFPPMAAPPTPLPVPPAIQFPPPSPDSFASAGSGQLGQPEELPTLPLLNQVDLRDMAYANQLLENTQYGLDLGQLLSPGSGFKAEARGGQVLLSLPPSGISPQGKQQGTAEELCRVVGNQLRQVLGGQYDFRMAEGFCGEYFIPEVGYNHTFLLMTPHRNPSQQIIIDPTLKKTGRVELLPQYTIRALKPLEPVAPAMPTVKAVYIPPVGYAEAIPLGFAEDLMPNTSKIPAKALLYLTFEMKNGCPSVVLAAQTSPRGLVIADPQIHTVLRPDDLLARFLNRVRGDLRGCFPMAAPMAPLPAPPLPMTLAP
jgi:hypothetical protein